MLIDEHATYRFLLLRLTERRGCPSNDDRVDRICAHGEDEARDVATSRVHRACRNHKPDNSHEKPDRDMPRTLVHPSGAPAGENAGRACKQKRRTCEHKSDGSIEAESTDDAVQDVRWCLSQPFGDIYVGKNELKEQALR
jgi:hypothetical protein